MTDPRIEQKARRVAHTIIHDWLEDETGTAVEQLDRIVAKIAAAIQSAVAEEAEWWAHKAGHIGPAKGIEVDKNCELCCRIVAIRARGQKA